MGSIRVSPPGWLWRRPDVRAPVRMVHSTPHSWEARLIATGALVITVAVWFAGRQRWLQQQA
jgi:hypothetical protein